MPSLKNNQIVELSVTEAKQALLNRSLTSMKYVNALFKRIKKFSPEITNDPKKLNALLYVNKVAALKAANAADKKYKSGQGIRKLEGIPFIVKDMFEVPNMPITLATNGIKNCIPSSYGPVLEALVNEGAIIIGKANMSELGWMLHTANNNFAGVARNPHNLAHHTGGSSGGSAAAVAARLAAMSIGNDLGGSIRWPASCNGVIGFRPTQDRWSNLGTSVGVAGAIDDETQSGCFSRSFDDAILIDSIVTGDNTVVNVVNSSLRVGIPRMQFFNGIDPQILAGVDDTLAKLTQAGVTVVEADMSDSALLAQYTFAWAIVFNYAHSGPNSSIQAQYDAWANDPENPFQPITYAQVDAQATSPDAVAAIAGATTLPTDPGTVGLANFIRAQIIAMVHTYMNSNNLDMFVLPIANVLTVLNPDPTLLSGIGSTKAMFVPLIKFPSISIPIGIDTNNVPFGIDFVARPNEDRKLLHIVKSLKSRFANIPAPHLHKTCHNHDSDCDSNSDSDSD